MNSIEVRIRCEVHYLPVSEHVQIATRPVNKDLVTHTVGFQELGILVLVVRSTIIRCMKVLKREILDSSIIRMGQRMAHLSR